MSIKVNLRVAISLSRLPKCIDATVNWCLITFFWLCYLKIMSPIFISSYKSLIAFVFKQPISNNSRPIWIPLKNGDGGNDSEAWNQVKFFMYAQICTIYMSGIVTGGDLGDYAYHCSTVPPIFECKSFQKNWRHIFDITLPVNDAKLYRSRK